MIKKDASSTIRLTKETKERLRNLDCAKKGTSYEEIIKTLLAGYVK